MKITPDLFAAHLKCPTNCWLRARGEAGGENEYADWVRTQNESYRHDNAPRLLASFPETECVVAPSPAESPKAAKWRLAVDLQVQTNELESWLHAVERVPSEGRGKPAQFIPIRFVFTNKLTKDDKLLVAFDALVLSEVLGREVSLGKIIHGDDHATLKVKTSALFKEVRMRIEKIAALLANPSPPDLVLNRRCAECEFQKQCRQKAIEKDDLSLLAGMSEKERKKFNSKGIFTVTQLSYTFRPRRRPKRMRDKREKYHHALKALAIREKKIHIFGSPELKIEGTPVYLDVEGLPDRDFYYLIGLRIGNGESAVQHCLWADTVEDEGKIWREFLAILETVEKPVLIHYGSYETTFLKRMPERHGKPVGNSPTVGAIEKSLNLLSVIFAQMYFPTYSNGLKDIASTLSFNWSAPIASGAQSIIWRYTWEESQKVQDRAELVAYNTQDCQALAMVVKAIEQLGHPQNQPNKGNSADAVVFTDSLVGPQTLFRRFTSPVLDLEVINRAARWNYQRERIYIRSDVKINRARREQNKRKVGRGRINKLIHHPNYSICPRCRHRTKRKKSQPSTLYDIRFGRFSIKRWVVTYQYSSAWCSYCKFYSGRPKEFRLHSQYGRNLVAFVVFQVIGLCIPQQTVTEVLNRLFGIQISECAVNNFKASAGRCYKSSWEGILSRMLRGRLIQADETRISVKGMTSYVWVLTNLDSVIYLHTETREGNCIQELLRGFTGVLVSDFYAVYDSIACPQQKCLIHLLRDFNDELLSYPYDDGLKQLVTDFAQLLRPMIETVDRYGLKRHFLRKHCLFVERFYRKLSKTKCESEAVAKCRQRIEKNRDNLFTFLNYDGVPWNNNNAEHAIKAFAKLRRIIEGLSTPKGMEEYLTLLSISQTCKYQGLDFLDFLRSGEKDIEKFAESRRKKRKQPALDTSAATTTA